MIPAAVPSATNFPGASIVSTAAPDDADSVGVADASVDSLAVGAGAAGIAPLLRFLFERRALDW